MRNGFGEIENCLSVLLVHVERKEVEREDNFLQVMIKSLHELHNKEKSKLYMLSIFYAVSSSYLLNSIVYNFMFIPIQ